MKWKLSALAALAYLFGAAAGYAFMIRPAGMVVAWPPAGLLLGLLLIHSRRDWLPLIVGGLVGNAAADLWQGSLPSTAAMAAVANNVEAVLCAWVVTRLVGPEPSLRSLREVGALVVGSVLIGNALSSVLGAVVLMHGSGMSFWTGWYVWWTGDGLGQLLFAPLVLVVSAPGWWRMRGRESLAFLTLIALIGVVAWFVTTSAPVPGQALTASPYLVFPFLLLAASRFRAIGAVFANLTLAVVVLWFGSAGTGLFGRAEYSATDQVLQAWAFLGVAASTSLAIAGVLAERRATEERLRATENQFNQISENISEVVWISEAGLQRIEYLSWAFERIWGRSVEDFYRRPSMFFESVHPDDRQRIRKTFRARRGSPQSFEHEYRIVRPDGDVRWIADRGYPLASAPGAPQRYVGIAQDVTDRRRALAQMEMLGQAIESTNELVSVSDLDHRFTFVNQAFLRTYGYELGEVLGQTPAILFAPDDDGEMRSIIQEESRTRGWTGIVENRRKDGTSLTIELSTSPIRTQHGEVVALLGVARDITKRLQLESDLRQAQKMDAIGQLAGGIAHDFNNLLTVIVGYTQILLDEEKPPVGWRDDMQQVHAAAVRASQLTRQLLAFGRRQALNVRTIDLVRTTADLLPMIGRLIGEHIRVTFDPAIGPTTVRADPIQVEQILMNLSVNARDSMTHGGQLTLSVAPRISTDDRPIVVLTVRDTGTGMDAATRHRIFEPFFTTKPVGQGTGLGLATVFSIVESLQGTVDVESAPGEGTTFTIALPYHAALVESSDAVPAQTNLRGNETVLVVEDETAIRHLIAQVLESYGYRMYLAGTHQEALEVSTHPARIDLLIADIRLPGGSGLDLAARLLTAFPGLRVLFITGYADDQQDRAAPRMGNLLAKPFDGCTLAEAVRQVLDADQDRDSQGGATAPP